MKWHKGICLFKDLRKGIIITIAVALKFGEPVILTHRKTICTSCSIPLDYPILISFNCDRNQKELDQSFQALGNFNNMEVKMSMLFAARIGFKFLKLLFKSSPIEIPPIGIPPIGILQASAFNSCNSVVNQPKYSVTIWMSKIQLSHTWFSLLHSHQMVHKNRPRL